VAAFVGLPKSQNTLPVYTWTPYLRPVHTTWLTKKPVVYGLIKNPIWPNPIFPNPILPKNHRFLLVRAWMGRHYTLCKLDYRDLNLKSELNIEILK